MGLRSVRAFSGRNHSGLGPSIIFSQAIACYRRHSAPPRSCSRCAQKSTVATRRASWQLDVHAIHVPPGMRTSRPKRAGRVGAEMQPLPKLLQAVMVLVLWRLAAASTLDVAMHAVTASNDTAIKDFM